MPVIYHVLDLMLAFCTLIRNLYGLCLYLILYIIDSGAYRPNHQSAKHTGFPIAECLKLAHRKTQ